MKLLIATTNPAKLLDIRKYLADFPLQPVTLNDLLIKEHPIETGNIFLENAVLKARFYCQTTNLPTIADDGGAEIDVLGGQPGVKTRRWVHSDRDSTDEELISYTLNKLRGVPLEKRGMQLRLVLALAFPNGKVFTSEGRIRGIVAQIPSPHRRQGYPFRCLMFLPQIHKFYNVNELTVHESNEYDHRKSALNKLIPIMKNN